MLQQIDRKFSFIFYLLILVLLSSTNNIEWIKKKNSFLKIKEIHVDGLELKLNNDIKKEFDFLIGKNIFFLDSNIFIDKLKNINYIEDYKISKIFPLKIDLKLKKAKYLAKTYKENKTYYIGSNKKYIFSEQVKNNDDYPTVFGKFAINEFFKLINIFLENNFNIENFENYYYFPSSRWDIKLKNNILIKLPAKNTNYAVNIVKKIIKENLNEDKKVIDLRIQNQIIFSNE